MEKILNFQGKAVRNAGFFGLGRSSLALLDFLKREYGNISFTLRSDFPVENTSGFDRAFIGKAALTDICEDILFLSPSVKRDRPELIKAFRRGVILSSDTEFFFEKKNIPVLAVTGSDGKSTTATLASLMLSEDGESFPASANIGLPMSALLCRKDLCGTVAELSSFQLMYFVPRLERALITGITENHLDWHSSFEEYVRAKENAFINAKKRIFSLDTPESAKMAKKYPAFAVYSSSLSYKEMKKDYNAEHYFSFENRFLYHSGEPFLSEDEIIIRGRHNISNLLGAAALSAQLVSKEKIIATARSFSGLSHRARLVASYDGISFYDSSVDSTPSRTAVTLSSFDTPLVLILGGRGKRLSYAPLLPLSHNIKAIVITGENRDEIKEALCGDERVISGKIKIYIAADFTEAVLCAIDKAKRADTVLLSPASTSLDAFSSYKERGELFQNIIKKYYAADLR